MSDGFPLSASLPEFLLWLKEQKVDKRLYMHYIDRFLGQKARAQGVPLFIKFELTPLCNLDCRMCYVHLTKEQMKSRKLLPLETWKAFADEAARLGTKQVELTGGECLTYPWFDELYLYLHSIGLEVSVYTNGVLLNAERVGFFKKHPPKSIQVTLYGCDEETYENVTGHRLFSRVTENIKYVVKNELPLTIAVTPNNFMLGRGEEIVKTAHSFGVPVSVNFALLNPREETERAGEEIDVSVEEYAKMLTVNAELNGFQPMPVDEMSLPDVGEDEGKKEYGIRCGAGRDGFSIDWKGAMHPCNSLYTISNYPLDVGIEKAWKEINSIAKSFPRAVECIDCAYQSSCQPCLALQLQGAEVGHANPVLCKRARLMTKIGLIKI